MIESVSKAKLKGAGFAAIIALIAAFLVSMLFWQIENKGTRRVFLFESKANPRELSYEVRYLRKLPGKNAVQQYVDELLLGPVSPQGRLLFPSETYVRSCFLDGRVLYIDLSEEALQLLPTEASGTVFAIEILKKNLFTNFKNVGIINVFIMGNRVEA